MLELGIKRVAEVEFGLGCERFESGVGRLPILLLILGVCGANEE